MIIFVGSLFMLVFTFFLALLCGDIAVFVDIPSLLVIILPLIFFFATTKSGKPIGGYIKSSFKRDHQYGVKELEAIVLAAKNTIRFTMAMGYFGFFVGIIAMLANISDTSHIGPSLAVGLITVFYAIAVAYFVFFPVQAWAENKLLKGDGE